MCKDYVGPLLKKAKHVNTIFFLFLYKEGGDSEYSRSRGELPIFLPGVGCTLGMAL